MSEPQLVRINVYESGEDPFLGYAWGLWRDSNDDDEFLILYTRSKRVESDLGKSGDVTGISGTERDTMVNVDECWTPSCVYVEAAKHALVGADG